MRSIVYSSTDPAGVNASKHLKNAEASLRFVSGNEVKSWSLGSFELVEVSVPLLEASFLDGLSSDLVVFCSKHASAAGVKAFTTHFTGDFKQGLFGKAAASSAKAAFNFFLENRLDGFSVSREVTHHSPFLKTPSVFVELGSSEEGWASVDGGRILAGACLAALNGFDVNQGAFIGVGGPHYSPAFTSPELILSHVIPKHALEFVSAEMLGKMVGATAEKVEGVLVDWKGCGSFKQKVVEACEEAGLSWEKF